MGAEAYPPELQEGFIDRRRVPPKCPICGDNKFMKNEFFYYECINDGGRVVGKRKEDKEKFEEMVRAEEQAEEDKKLKQQQQDWA